MHHKLGTGNRSKESAVNRPMEMPHQRISDPKPWDAPVNRGFGFGFWFVIIAIIAGGISYAHHTKLSTTR